MGQIVLPFSNTTTAQSRPDRSEPHFEEKQHHVVPYFQKTLMRNTVFSLIDCTEGNNRSLPVAGVSVDACHAVGFT
jgi:hypothetical protein